MLDLCNERSRGLSLRHIARELGVALSTVCRERKRNRGKEGYNFQRLDKLVRKRWSVARSQPKRLTPDILWIIEGKLKEMWSPEQISGRLRKEGIFIHKATLYRGIFAGIRNKGVSSILTLKERSTISGFQAVWPGSYS
jgi:transposase, IS30 family